MRVTKIFLLCLWVIITSNTWAQENSIGAYISLTNDIYKIDDPHRLINAIPLRSPEVAIYWRHTFDTDFFTQLGTSTKTYWEGFGFNGDRYGAGGTNAFTTIKLNADVGSRMRLTKKLSLVPRAGFSVARNLAPYVGTVLGIDSITSNGLHVESTYQEDPYVHRVFLLIHGAIGVEYDLLNSFVVTIHVGFHTGFMKANVLNDQYRVDGSQLRYATLTSCGEYKDFGIGIAYKINTILKKN